MGAAIEQNIERTSSEHVSIQMHTPPTPPPPGVRSTCTPLGLIAFGMCGFMMTFLDTEWVPGGFAPVVVAYASVFAGLAEFIAGLFELIRGHTFAGTAFGSYGCFWMGLYVWKMMEIKAEVAAVAAIAVKGYTLWCGLWGFLSFFFFLCTLRASNSLQYLFASVALFFWLSCGASYNHNCSLAAGYVLMTASMSAIYGAFGMLFEEIYGWQLPFMKPTNYFNI